MPLAAPSSTPSQLPATGLGDLGLYILALAGWAITFGAILILTVRRHR